MDDIHPFYADLMNVLYDRDHYKLALGQLSIARRLIDNLSKDYVRLMKFASSLYQCKQLKRAAMGRMCTIIKKLRSSLVYLEQVRQHLSRLPSIDPTTRTLILCGYPNVGKSSFINNLTRANVDVQPYAFTTKSLFVGHMDYKYLRWQVIDTPGLLDHPLENRNTIEMQSITALAHLHAAIVYIVDISEQCGYTIEQQVKLFDSIRPLFANKPIILAANKIDTVKFEDLSDEDKNILDVAGQSAGAPGLLMSTMTGDGVNEVKTTACERLLEKRVEIKMKGSRMTNVRNRLEVTMPKPRDGRNRPAYIPEAVLAKNAATKAKKQALERDDDEEDLSENIAGSSSSACLGPNSIFTGTHQYVRNWVDMGPYDQDKDPLFLFGPEWKERYMLKEDDWKWDKIPEIMDGKNVADFYDEGEDLQKMLDLLEKEEDERIQALENAMEEGDLEDDLTEEDMQALAEWREKKGLIKLQHRSKKIRNGAFMPRKTAVQHDGVEKFGEHLESIGIDSAAATTRMRSRSRGRAPRSGADASSAAMQETSVSRKRTRSEMSRAASKSPGIASTKMAEQAIKKARKSQTQMNRQARVGEGDRTQTSKLPKHLNSGKRGKGKTDSR